MTTSSAAAVVAAAQLFLIGCSSVAPSPAAATVPADRPSIDAERVAEAYIYGFPMMAAYKAMYEFNIDKSSIHYKGPFNRLAGAPRVFTPNDTSVVTPNSDVPYAMVHLDLRAEPMVLCVPEIEKRRYYSIQLVDQYTFNYGYIGSRTTGNGPGCYVVAGPRWDGAVPPAINQGFRSETDFSLAIYRTQLLGRDDLDRVKKIQAQYTVQPLSAYAKRKAPTAPAPISFPKFAEDAFKSNFIRYLNFVLQFCPAGTEERELRARFAEIGIQAGRSFEITTLGAADRTAIEAGVARGRAEIAKRRDELGRDENGWRVGSAFGSRASYQGDYLSRAAAALAGVFGNDAAEALYPMATTDASGDKLDGSRNRYMVTFPSGQLPPVNAFWSLTMYDGKTQQLVANSINRYVISSPMLASLKKNADGSITMYIQKDPPPADTRTNWLPAPDGPIYLVMRLYWPRPDALDGSWKPPAIQRAPL